jgi:hypothetical protein
MSDGHLHYFDFSSDYLQTFLASGLGSSDLIVFVGSGSVSSDSKHCLYPSFNLHYLLKTHAQNRSGFSPLIHHIDQLTVDLFDFAVAKIVQYCS